VIAALAAGCSFDAGQLRALAPLAPDGAVENPPRQTLPHPVVTASPQFQLMLPSLPEATLCQPGRAGPGPQVEPVVQAESAASVASRPAHGDSAGSSGGSTGAADAGTTLGRTVD